MEITDIAVQALKNGTVIRTLEYAIAIVSAIYLVSWAMISSLTKERNQAAYAFMGFNVCIVLAILATLPLSEQERLRSEVITPLTFVPIFADTMVILALTFVRYGKQRLRDSTVTWVQHIGLFSIPVMLELMLVVARQGSAVSYAVIYSVSVLVLCGALLMDVIKDRGITPSSVLYQMSPMVLLSLVIFTRLMSLVTTDRLTSAEANVAQIQSGADNYVTWFYLFLLLLINVTLIFQVVNSHIETIARMARTDTLTKVATRAVLEEKMEQERLRMTRTKKEYSLIFLDIDHFKSVNDTLGHNGGDAALKFVAQILKSTVRRSDLVGRWGGEEFLIVLPETDSAKAFQVAEKARLALMATPMIWKGEAVLLTASFGVSVCLEKDSGISDIVSRADAAMYVAKETGRNRCVNAEEGTKET